MDNDGMRRFEVFNVNGDFIRSVDTVPNGHRISRLAAIDDSFFICTPTEEHLITEYLFTGELVQQFGTFNFGGPFREKRARNKSHLGMIQIDGADYVLCANKSEGKVDLYSRAGKNVAAFDLSDNHFFQPRLDFKDSEFRQDAKNKESTYILFQDIYIWEDRLFILFCDRDGQATKIIAYRLSLQRADFVELILLPYPSDVIAVHERDLYAFGRDSGLVKFALVPFPERDHRHEP